MSRAKKTTNMMLIRERKHVMTDDLVQRAIEATAKLYTDKTIKPFNPDLQQQIAGKNALYQGDLDGIGRVRWLVSFPGQKGDWGLNKGGLLYLKTALQEGKIAAGIVVLRRKNANVNVGQVKEVWNRLKDADWIEGSNGEFVYVNERFEPTNFNSGRYITDPDEPM